MLVDKVKALINKYDLVKTKGQIKSYDEANTCKDFILPLFEALGWDISNREEVTAQASASRGRVDYAFCIKGIPKFFLEAKSLKVDLNDTRWAEQTINYAWHKGVVWAVLTDFEAIKVFNAEWITKNPSESLFFEIRYDKYSENFDQLSLLSKQAFLENRLDKEAEKWGKKRRKIPVDEKLLSDILKWRNLLANSLRKNHPALLEEELDESIQRILDRLIFIRTCEDRNIEPNTLSPLLREWLDSGKKRRLSQELKSVFRNFDDGYNSQIFSPHLCEDLKIDESVLEVIINGLYETEDRSIRYDFSAIDADVLGSMYEQYLGHILKKTPTRTTVTEKHLRRKEMGIYYTPKYIVDYIVKNTVGELLKEKPYKEAMKLKILDPACGSGSFLIRAFEEMDNYLRDKRSQKGEEFAYFRRMEILNNNLYGVDLDKQAVEIAQLNLLLKALESRQKLPVIKNIRQGNSLISGDESRPSISQNGYNDVRTKDIKEERDELTMYKYFGKNWKEKHPFNWQEEYSEVFKDGGFDVIIGNPPYVRNRELRSEEKNYFKDKYYSADGQYDLYQLFFEVAIRLLKNGGYLGFITSNKYTVADYGKQLRKFILDNCSIKEIIDVSNIDVFKDAATYPYIVILKKEQKPNIRNSSLIQACKAKSADDILTPANFFTVPQNTFIKVPSNIFNITLSNEDDVILEKIKNKSIRLGDFCLIRETIHTGNIREKVLSLKKVNEKSKKVIGGRDLWRYGFSWSKKWIQYDPAIINRKNGEYGNFPDKVFFESPKIFVRDIALRLTATFDDEKYYSLNTLYSVICKKQIFDLKYILGILNSSLIHYFFTKNFAAAHVRGGFLRFKPMYTSQLPIRKIDFTKPKEKKMHDDLVKLVDKMLDLNKQIQKIPEKSDKWYNLKSEIEKTDERIDEMVYKLYGITEIGK